MRYRRQRRPGSRGQWFPTSTASSTTIASSTAGTVALQPLISSGLDNTPDPNVTFAGASAGQLGNALRGNSYLVKRIVGQVFAGCDTNANTGITEAFFGLGVVEQTSAGGQQATEPARWNPWLDDTAQKRWLFRRFWLFSGANTVWASGLNNNTQTGDVRSGPFVDSKVMAKIGYEERLVMIFGARRIVGAAENNVTFIPRLRLFGKSVFYPPRT